MISSEGLFVPSSVQASRTLSSAVWSKF
jgi:hypothetical protein